MWPLWSDTNPNFTKYTIAPPNSQGVVDLVPPPKLFVKISVERSELPILDKKTSPLTRPDSYPHSQWKEFGLSTFLKILISKFLDRFHTELRQTDRQMWSNIVSIFFKNKTIKKEQLVSKFSTHYIILVNSPMYKRLLILNG